MQGGIAHRYTAKINLSGKTKMNYLSYTILILITLFVNIYGQTDSLKNNAVEVFKTGDYEKAIEILKQAEIAGANDPEVYYLLGYYSHYLAYDSRPLIDYNEKYSNKILRYLEKAIELNPNYRNAYYFIGAEYGARALNALQTGNSESYISNYKKAYEKGAFPLWLIEYGKNILNSCDENAILIVGGDAEFNPIQYLQLIEHYRRDITVIPYGFLNRPWYIEKLRTGVKNLLKNVPISFSEEQVYNMHPYKWDTLTIEIPISEKLKKEFELTPDKTFSWKLEPNMISGEKTYLSADKAIFANIVKTNGWERSIYFSLGCNPSFFSGLKDYFQLCGLAYKLLPKKTENAKNEINPNSIVNVLLDKKNIKNFSDVDKHDMPRASNILNNYYAVLYRLAALYKEQNQLQKINEIGKYINENLLSDIFPSGKNILKLIEELSSK